MSQILQRYTDLADEHIGVMFCCRKYAENQTDCNSCQNQKKDKMCPFQDFDRNNFEFPKAKELVIFDPNACRFFFFFADNFPNDKSEKPAYEINRSYKAQDNTKG